jgi:hypothetical protein
MKFLDPLAVRIQADVDGTQDPDLSTMNNTKEFNHLQGKRQEDVVPGLAY